MPQCVGFSKVQRLNLNRKRHYAFLPLCELKEAALAPFMPSLTDWHESHPFSASATAALRVSALLGYLHPGGPATLLRAFPGSSPVAWMGSPTFLKENHSFVRGLLFSLLPDETQFCGFIYFYILRNCPQWFQILLSFKLIAQRTLCFNHTLCSVFKCIILHFLTPSSCQLQRNSCHLFSLTSYLHIFEYIHFY